MDHFIPFNFRVKADVKISGVCKCSTPTKNAIKTMFVCVKIVWNGKKQYIYHLLCVPNDREIGLDF